MSKPKLSEEERREKQKELKKRRRLRYSQGHPSIYADNTADYIERIEAHAHDFDPFKLASDE